MSAQILDGNRLARAWRARLAEQVAELVEQQQRPPGLAVVLVGNDPASEVYVRNKRRDCEEVGFKSNVQHLSDNVTQRELEDLITALNHDDSIDGILVQLPLPAHIEDARIIDHIDPLKDVDGFHAYNLGRLALRRPTLRSCTPKGIMALLEHTGLELRGLDATVIGASNHVGRPMLLELLLAGCTVTCCHKFTSDTGARARSADILVSAVGHPGLVPGDWIKPGAVVIDVGITRDDSGRLRGDVRFEEAMPIAGWLTPVPGGVGPMTRVAMLDNTLASRLSRDPAPALPARGVPGTGGERR